MDVLITKIFFNTLYLSTYKITNIAHIDSIGFIYSVSN